MIFTILKIPSNYEIIKRVKDERGLLTIIIGVVVIIGFILAGFYIYHQKTKYYSSLQQEAIDKNLRSKLDNASAAASQTISTVPTNWKYYSNSQYKFSIQYPPEWQYKENDPPTPNLNKYHVTFYSPDRNSVLDLAIIEGNFEEAKKGLSASNKVMDENINDLTGLSIVDDMGNKTLTYFQSPFSSSETVVLTYLTKTDYLTLENIKNTLDFSQ